MSNRLRFVLSVLIFVSFTLVACGGSAPASSTTVEPMGETREFESGWTLRADVNAGETASTATFFVEDSTITSLIVTVGGKEYTVTPNVMQEFPVSLGDFFGMEVKMGGKTYIFERPEAMEPTNAYMLYVVEK